MTTFKFAVSKLKRASKEWMTDEDYPALHMLEALAESLDENLAPSMINAYGVAYRAFIARKPVAPQEEDELAKALREATEDSRPPKAGSDA